MFRKIPIFCSKIEFYVKIPIFENSQFPHDTQFGWIIIEKTVNWTFYATELKNYVGFWVCPLLSTFDQLILPLFVCQKFWPTLKKWPLDRTTWKITVVLFPSWHILEPFTRIYANFLIAKLLNY